jgi:hypothetical protein
MYESHKIQKLKKIMKKHYRNNSPEDWNRLPVDDDEPPNTFEPPPNIDVPLDPKPELQKNELVTFNT